MGFDVYLKTFHRIFERSNHEGHYRMMMGVSYIPLEAEAWRRIWSVRPNEKVPRHKRRQRNFGLRKIKNKEKVSGTISVIGQRWEIDRSFTLFHYYQGPPHERQSRHDKRTCPRFSHSLLSFISDTKWLRRGRQDWIGLRTRHTSWSAWAQMLS
jgi:hypothetical protein